tara:strand:+ start:347 stop:475 length:129 start_codon:yes stop_codon:yes gene_type:complete
MKDIDKDILQLITKRLKIKTKDITRDEKKYRIDLIVKTVLSV